MGLGEVLQKVAQDPSLTSSTVAKRVGLFVKLMQRFIDEQPKLLLSELYHLILDETGYVLDLRKEGTEESTARIENMEEFNSLLQEFEEDFFEKIPEIEREAKKVELLPLFIEQSALASDIDQLSGDTSAVKLMTLHSSKGLEFPVVFLVGMEEGLFPSIKPWEETPDEDIEEERRLCYVGMTRARETLYLMSATIRRIWGNISYQEPSRFFAEIPEECIEFRDHSYGSRASEFRTGSSRQFGFTAHASSDRGDRADRADRDSGSQVNYDSGNRPMGQVVGRIGPTASTSPFGSGLTKDEWIGKQISHPEYGKGTVVASEGAGQDQKVTIQFLSRQQKKFLLRYVASYFG